MASRRAQPPIIHVREGDGYRFSEEQGGSTVKRACALGLLACLIAGPATAGPFSDDEIRIGVLTDLTGLSRVEAGQNSVVAAEMAVEEFGGEVAGIPVEIIAADHRSDTDVALSAAEKLVEQRRVDMITGLVRSNTAIPVQRYATPQDVIVMVAGGGSSSLHGKYCSPLAFHWAFDTFALAKGTALAVTAQGGDSWYFLTADYAFGHFLEEQGTAIIEANGGEVLGASRYPYKDLDLSAEIMAARASGAKVIGLASGGKDTQRAVRQSYELGVAAGGQRLVAMLMFITDVRRLGLYVTSGLQLVTSFFWNYDERTLAWSREFHDRTGAMPTMIQAGVYSTVKNYLAAIEAVATDDPSTVAEKIRATPVDDMFARNGYVREDGLLVHDIYLVEVKSPMKATGAWDYYELVDVIPGKEAYPPLSESACPLVN